MLHQLSPDFQLRFIISLLFSSFRVILRVIRPCRGRRCRRDRRPHRRRRRFRESGGGAAGQAGPLRVLRPEPQQRRRARDLVAVQGGQHLQLGPVSGEIIFFRGFWGIRGTKEEEEGEERRGLQNLVIIYQQMHSADPNFGQKFSRTTENWHMDLYGLILEYMASEDMPLLESAITAYPKNGSQFYV